MSIEHPHVAANEPANSFARSRLVPVVIEGTLSPEAQERAVRAFAALVAELLLEEACQPDDSEPLGVTA